MLELTLYMIVDRVKSGPSGPRGLLTSPPHTIHNIVHYETIKGVKYCESEEMRLNLK